MAEFNIDAGMVLETIAQGLEDAAAQVSETQFIQIANTIEEKLPMVVEILTYGMQESWKEEARNSGTGWGPKYANAIKAKVTGNMGVVYVDESMIDKTSNKPNIFFVKMVEEGMRSFDIKTGLMASEKAKMSSDGIKYIVIPFPVRAPAKPDQGQPASHFGGREMTQEAYDLIKSGKRFSGKLKGGQEVSGLTQYRTRQFHEQFGMFIAVSEKSQGWIHPGVAPNPVYQNVLAEVNKQIQKVLSAFVQSVVREYTQ